jgi:cation diffusion facilitator family transporter
MASSSKKIIYAALAGNLLIAFTKFIASMITGSSAMVSEAIHSVVDTGNQVLLLLGLRRSKKPPDEKFPFGYGQEVYFWSFIVAILIFAVGSGVSLYEGVHRILHPQAIGKPLTNYIVLGFAFIFEGVAWFLALKEFLRAKGENTFIETVAGSKDPTLFVVLFEDSAAMLGIIAALIGIWLSQVLGNPLFDGIASVLIGIILGITAACLACKTKGLLIGESASPDLVKRIRDMATAQHEIESVNEILTMHLGPDDILVNISVDFANDILSQDVENTIARLNREIKTAFPGVKRLFLEAEARSGKKPDHPRSINETQ